MAPKGEQLLGPSDFQYAGIPGTDLFTHTYPKPTIGEYASNIGGGLLGYAPEAFEAAPYLINPLAAPATYAAKIAARKIALPGLLKAAGQLGRGVGEVGSWLEVPNLPQWGEEAYLGANELARSLEDVNARREEKFASPRRKQVLAAQKTATSAKTEPPPVPTPAPPAAATQPTIEEANIPSYQSPEDVVNASYQEASDRAYAPPTTRAFMRDGKYLFTNAAPEGDWAGAKEVGYKGATRAVQSQNIARALAASPEDPEAVGMGRLTGGFAPSSDVAQSVVPLSAKPGGLGVMSPGRYMPQTQQLVAEEALLQQIAGKTATEAAQRAKAEQEIWDLRNPDKAIERQAKLAAEIATARASALSEVHNRKIAEIQASPEYAMMINTTQAQLDKKLKEIATMPVPPEQKQAMSDKARAEIDLVRNNFIEEKRGPLPLYFEGRYPSPGVDPSVMGIPQQLPPTP